MPFTTICVTAGTSKVIPCGGFFTTGCEKPTLSSKSVPRMDAR
jgi:hypothetical protein